MWIGGRFTRRSVIYSIWLFMISLWNKPVPFTLMEKNHQNHELQNHDTFFRKKFNQLFWPNYQHLQDSTNSKLKENTPEKICHWNSKPFVPNQGPTDITKKVEKNLKSLNSCFSMKTKCYQYKNTHKWSRYVHKEQEMIEFAK